MSIVVGAVAAGMAAVAAGKPRKLKNIGAKKKAWLDAFTPVAKEICTANKVPFQVCVTQAALESGWGSKAGGFNYFGIKGSGDAGTQEFVSSEYLKGSLVSKKMNFAKFSSMAAGIQGYCNVMTKNPRFSKASELFPNDPVSFFIWIWSAGYATSPSYVSTCIGVISVLYRATGNEDYHVVATKEQRSIISKLVATKPGKTRMAAALKALNVPEQVASSVMYEFDSPQALQLESANA